MIGLGFLVTCLTFWGSAQMPSTTDWRGLSPLKSTRMDVERTLGTPDQQLDQQVTYVLPDVHVIFYFTSNPKCREKLPYTSWNVAADILTGIDVSLRHPPLVTDTGIDLTKFKKIKENNDLIDRYHYLNGDNSFAIEVDNNRVAGYHYVPGSKHLDLRCEAAK